MSSWKTYARAARNTARRQAPDLSRQARDSVRRSSQRAGDYARAAGRAAEGGTRDSRRHLRERGVRYRRDAAAYTEVTRRHLKRARIGQRLLAALRDALIMGASIGVIWFVVTRTGVQIPITAVLIVVLLLMVLRFGWALFAGLGGEDEADEAEETTSEAREREYDPSDQAGRRRSEELERVRDRGTGRGR
ncbi:hypothetical protein [Brachybacterium endophyticum]|uniref:hypothetical protein n=1 Tax=Brachybacterium endophyticum TaxID=2182385 RepID=UPI00196A5C27|nr:hypothetical protein [Brachybacterium endophyticum]